jgi:hypothetical protein
MEIMKVVFLLVAPKTFIDVQIQNRVEVWPMPVAILRGEFISSILSVTGPLRGFFSLW